MRKVIDFQRALEEKDGVSSGDLTVLMRRASLVLKRSESESGTISNWRPGHVFEGMITKEILSKKLIGSDVMLCGIYVARLLEKLVSEIPESWWAVDYAGSDDPLRLRNGGDTCLVLCGVFPERCEHRLMSIEYYQKMGASFYYKFYLKAGKEIGYLMSTQFLTMASVMRSCIGKPCG